MRSALRSGRSFQPVAPGGRGPPSSWQRDRDGSLPVTPACQSLGPLARRLALQAPAGPGMCAHARPLSGCRVRLVDRAPAGMLRPRTMLLSPVVPVAPLRPPMLSPCLRHSITVPSALNVVLQNMVLPDSTTAAPPSLRKRSTPSYASFDQYSLWPLITSVR